jgi:hypothetical protein
MVDWEKTDEEMPQMYPSFKGANGAYWGRMGEPLESGEEAEAKFKIDDEEMFVANNCITDEYFVVL